MIGVTRPVIVGRWGFLVIVILTAFLSDGLGATVAWKAGSSGNWNDPGNWSGNAVPSAGDIVLITNAGTYTVSLNVSASVSELTLTAPTGKASLLLNAGTLTIDNLATVGAGGALRLDSGGILSGSGDISINEFTWSGGQIEGAGKLVFPAGAVVDVVNGGQHNLRDRTIVNGTTVNWPSETPTYVGFGTVWQNQAGSVLEMSGDAQMYFWGGNPGSFQNAGTVRKSGGAAVGYFDWNFTNAGTVSLQKGTLNFRQGYVQTGGRTDLTGGNYGGAPVLMDIQGGTLEGAGLIDTGVSIGGELRPGNPLGTLSVGSNWNHTNTVSSRSIFQLGGLEKGVSYDHFAVGGALNINGELKIEFANGFEPSGGDAFELMHGALVKGTFTATNPPSGFAPDLTYTTTNVVLRLIKTGIVAPQITTQPLNVTVKDGQPASFQVIASGGGLTYQWRKNGTNINGATAATYSIAAVRFSDTGSYTVVVANAGGSQTSDGAVLRVIPTNLDSGLVARYAFEENLNDSVSGRNGVTNGSPGYVPGVLGKAVRLDGRTSIPLGSNPAELLVDANNAISASFWIHPRALKEMVPLRLATAFGEFAVYLSAGPTDGYGTHFGFRGHLGPMTRDPRATFESKVGCWTHVVVVFQGGSPDSLASYALFINGESVPFDSSVQLGGPSNLNELGTNLQGVNGWVIGDMDEVRVYGRALLAEESVVLAAAPPECLPEIVQQPVDAGAQLGGTIRLEVGAIGGASLRYQWFKGPIAVPNATNAVYSVIAAPEIEGTYYVSAKNDRGEVRSVEVNVNVVVPPPPGYAGLTTGTSEAITAASFLSPFSGWYTTLGGSVYLTGNGGSTWTFSNTGFNVPLYAIQLVGGVGYIAGAGGTIGISTNNGASWIRYSTGTTVTFYGLSFYTSQSGWAVGSGGTICYYNGSSWVPYATGTGETFYSVAVDGGTSGVAWAVGSSGIICRYSGGQWIPVQTGTSATFYGVSFLNPSFGYAVGSGGTICRWNGTAWVALNTGTTGTFRNVVIVDATTAYAIGDGGLFCVTRDGGTTWTSLGSGTKANLNGLAFSGGRLFSFGAGGTGFSFVSPGQVVNQPPNIAILFPAPNASFLACLHIPVTAAASDPDGTVSKVEFYRGQFKLAEFTTPPPRNLPFRTRFDTTALGSYELRAVATDNSGASTVSEPVTINVLPWPLDTGVVEDYNNPGGCTLCLFGEVGEDYILQRTDDIVPPQNWTSISTNNVPEPFLRVTDTNVVGRIKRFYRFQKVNP